MLANHFSFSFIELPLTCKGFVICTDLHEPCCSYTIVKEKLFSGVFFFFLQYSVGCLFHIMLLPFLSLEEEEEVAIPRNPDM